MTVRQRSFQSGIVVMSSSFVAQLLQAVSTIVLARLLEPNDFGLVSLAVVLIGATGLFSGMGMGSAVIASKEDSGKAAYHGAVLTVVTGLAFMIFVMAVAPLFAQWFGKFQLIAVIRWMAILILLQTLSIVPNALLMKEMMFGRQVLPKTTASLSKMLVAIVMAYAGCGFWSLVAGQIAGGLVGLVFSLAVCPSLGWLKPQKWSSSLAKEMGRFGLTNMSTGAVQYVYNQGDYVVVGKALGTVDLGFYTQAYNLANLPVNTVSMVANTVLFPAYTKIRDSAKKLAIAFLDSFGLVSVITIPMAIGLFILAPDLIIFLIGEKWRSSIPVLRVFSMLSLVRPLSGVTSSLFLAVNRPGYNFRTAVIQCITMFIFIFVFLHWGTPGVALGVVLAFSLGIVYNFYLVCRKTGLPISVHELLARLAPALLSSGVMAITVVGLRQIMIDYVGGTQNIFSLGGLIVSGILSYTFSLFVLNRKVVFVIFDLLRASLRSVSGKKK